MNNNVMTQMPEVSCNFVLNNGNSIPVIGYGTGVINIYGFKSVVNNLLTNGGHDLKMIPKQKKAIRDAVKTGYRLFDTAFAYGYSEKLTSIATNKAMRKDTFIITKISNQQQIDGNIERSFEQSIKKLNTDYIDLYLLHWPKPETYINTWKQMERLYEQGLVKNIGVSNCHQHHLEKLLASANVLPAANEIERHPLLSQKPLIDYCKNQNIQVIAYTPLGRMNDSILRSHCLVEISRKHDKTISQTVLRWQIQSGVVCIPHSTNEMRIKENYDVFDFQLTTEEMTRIDAMNANIRFRYDPDNCLYTKPEV